MAKTKSLEGLACYACEKPAVSWEHAPPKGFYPRREEVNDIPSGKDYRQGLTMVPSCKVHNTAKSKDDNFSQAVIIFVAAAYGGHLKRPDPHPFVLSAIRKIQTGLRLRKALIEDASPVQTPQGLLIALKPEAATIRSTMELVARALYYYEHNFTKRWPNECVIQTPFFLMDDLSPHPAAATLDKTIKIFDEMIDKKHPDFDFSMRGHHTEVFAYQLIETDLVAIMRMRLYGGFDFVATSRRPQAPPPPED